MDVSRRSLGRSLAGVAGLGAVGTFAYDRVFAPSAASEPTALVAGSLLAVADRVPGASVEAHGSAAVRRLIVDGLREPDAVALADPRLFDGVSRRATLFATNALVVTYDPSSEYAADLKRDWKAGIAADGIRLGRTDPTVDPLGYRTVMAMRLAADEYGVDADAVLDASTLFPETGLLNALEGGAVDAAFTYRSMAVERDLPSVPLPDAIDFSDPDHADSYATVSFELPEGRVRGAPIRYAAAATTERGRPWVEALVAGTDRLREHGFAVPDDYPAREVRVGDDGPD